MKRFMNEFCLFLSVARMESQLRTTCEGKNNKTFGSFALDNFPSIIEKIEMCLSSFLSEIEEYGAKEGIKYLKKCFSERECPKIDYENFGITFARGYFLENFLKAAAVFQTYPLDGQHIADLGCGSGATTIAFLSHAK